jgi:hypothetical protein
MKTIQPSPKQYSAETVCPNGERIVLHVHGVMERLELHRKTGPTRITIRRPDQGVEWSLSANANTCSEAALPSVSDPTPLPALEQLLAEEWTEDGTEMIAGRPCRRWVGRFREPQLGRGNRTVCYVDAETGLRRREDHFDDRGELVGTTNYSPDLPPASLFELPEGCRAV